jgi:hypothetical protein
MTRVLLLPLVGVAAVSMACAPPAQPALICHNSNCVEPANPDEDDTVPALEASLALEEEGVPLIDGVEIDTFWFGEEARCLFAHDLERPGEYPDVSAATDVLNAWLSTRAAAGQPLTHRGDAFEVFVELKGHVAREKSARHTPEQRALHAACAVDVLEALAGPAIAGGRTLKVVFTSFDPDLLVAVHDALVDVAPSNLVEVQLGGLFGIPPPLDSQTLPVGAFGDVPLDLVSIHPHWVREAATSTFSSQGLEVGYWMFSAVPETLQAIERERPAFVTTSEARLLRAWIDR